MDEPVIGNLALVEVVIIFLTVLFLYWFGTKFGKAKSRHRSLQPLSTDLPPQKFPPGPATTKVFLAYRREDSADVTGRIYDKLVHHVGKAHVFKDVDSVPFGIDFRKHLDQVVGNCEIMLAVIGDRWLTAEDSKGARRLDDPVDLVRIEIESALRRDIPVVPVLVRGAMMPREADLPESIRAFAYRNAISVRADPDFHTDMERLLSRLGFPPKV